jgi:hypothetical protein
MPTTGLEIRLSGGARLVYWGTLGIGGLLMLAGFGSGERDLHYLIAACFLGIVARIVQAEDHFRRAGR